VLLALSTGHEIGLGFVALVFIAFALACSFLFPRWNPNFPGKRLGLFLGVVALLTLAQLAAVEKFAAESEAAGGDAGPHPTTSASTTSTGQTTTSSAPTGDAAAGKTVFTSSGCAACHTLEAANATGQVGPNLDDSLKDKDAGFIRTSIVDPNMDIAPGYSKGIMPPNFETQLSPKQIDDLVAFVYQSTHA
jgi:mono/diheme cytochrome c family protein